MCSSSDFDFKVYRLLIVLIVPCIFAAGLINCKTINEMSTPELIPFWGYKMENYTVRTDDNYLLTLHRIANHNSSYPPILFQHGILLASDVWILRGPHEDLALLLANEGFDVWLANTRGNCYSKEHMYYKYGEKRYWDFSWHEVGIYDIPAMVNFILKRTGSSQLIHVGHSMGNTAFYVMASTKPEMTDKIVAHVSLAPVVYMTHMKSLNVLTPFVEIRKQLVRFQEGMKMYSFFQRHSNIKSIIHQICNSERSKELCLRILFYFIGIDYNQVSKDYVFERYLGHFPSGASAKMLIHYAQNILTGDFREFDYGEKMNMIKYGNETAPDYKLTNIRTPIYIYYGTNDYFSHNMDVEKLVGKLRTMKKKYLVPYKKFNHMDFIWAKDAKTYLYDDVIRQLKIFRLD